MSVMLKDGMVLTDIDGKVSIDPACCCCACDPVTLGTIYQITGTFTSIIDVVRDTSGETSCTDVVYSGENDSGVLASIALNPTTLIWEVQFDDFGTVVTLSKIAGSGTNPDCDIESPTGLYAGDGYTASVGLII